MHCGLGPFASTRAGAILSMVFCFFVFLPPILTSLCPGTGLGVSARFQLPYRSPRHGSVAPSQPLNRYACDSSFVRAGSGCCVSDGLSSISLLRLHSSLLFILWVASCHACFDIPFLCPEWWSTNERGLKRNLTGTGIKPSPNVNVIFLHHWHSQPPGSPEPRRVSPNCSASKKGVFSRFVMKTPWKMTGNMSSMMCLL